MVQAWYMRKPPMIVVLAAAAVTLTACSSGGPSAKKSAELTVLTPASTVSLDPASSQNLATTTLSFLDRRLTTWDVKKGQDAKVVPDLATSTGTPSDGGKTWTYTLKSGLKFSDGSPITSE